MIRPKDRTKSISMIMDNGKNESFFFSVAFQRRHRERVREKSKLNWMKATSLYLDNKDGGEKNELLHSKNCFV